MDYNDSRSTFSKTPSLSHAKRDLPRASVQMIPLSFYNKENSQAEVSINRPQHNSFLNRMRYSNSDSNLLKEDDSAVEINDYYT